MKLLELAPEIVAEIIQETVLAVRVGQAFRLRLVCKTFDAQALRAIFTTRVIGNCPDCMPGDWGAEVIVPKYLESRSLAGSEDSNELLTAIRRTAKNLIVGDGEDDQYSFHKNISALCQAATIHLSSKVLRLLDPKKDGSDRWTYHKPVSSYAKVEDETNVLVGAAYMGNIVKVHEALSSRSNARRGSRFFGYPLQCACRQGHKDIVMLLLEYGGKGLCNVLSQRYSPMGFGTPLQSACSGGCEDIVRLLLDPKYNLGVSENEYFDLALRAARGGHLDIVMLLLQTGAPRSIPKDCLMDLLSEASKHGQEEFVRNVINHKSFTMKYFEAGLRMALWNAASFGHHGLVQLLLAQDAKGEYKNLLIPFSEASRHGFERVVRLVLEHRADTTEWPHILIPAASAGQAHIVSFLLEHRATLNPNGYGAFAVEALRYAMEAGHEAVVRLLNDHGISIEESPMDEH